MFHRNNITDNQLKSEQINAQLDMWAMKFDKSIELLEKSRELSPNGTHSGARLAPIGGHFEGRPEMPRLDYPKFMSHAAGSHIYDVDGNDFIDYCLALGPVILGHCNSKVNDAVKRQMDRGVIFGMNHEAEIELSELFTKHVPCAEVVNFVTTGSDATAAATRIARAYTRKQKIVKFAGHYHSWHDWNRFDSIQAGHLEENGIATSVQDDVIVLPWNEIETCEMVLKNRSGEIAAVICETMIGNFGCIQPEGDFLKNLRDLTRQEGIVLIFDEVVTGFRLGLGGAQQVFGVTPDLATFAKSMANGFPIGAVAGSREVMSGRGFIGGTYNSNPVSTAAAIATIRQLEDESKYAGMFENGKRLMKGIQDAANDAKVDCTVQGMPSLFSILFGVKEPVTRPEVLLRLPFSPHLRRCAAFFQGMVNGAVFNSPPSRAARWCLSTSHSREDVEKTITVAAESMKEAARIT